MSLDSSHLFSNGSGALSSLPEGAAPVFICFYAHNPQSFAYGNRDPIVSSSMQRPGGCMQRGAGGANAAPA